MVSPTRKPKYPLGNGRYTSDALVYSRYKTELNKKESDIKTQQKRLDRAVADKAQAEKDKAAYYQLLQMYPGNSGYLAAYDAAVKESTKQQKIIDEATTKIKALTTEKNSLSFKYNNQKPESKVTSSMDSSVPIVKTDSTLKPPFVYKYNAPMVKSAYINPFGPQVDSAGVSSLVIGSGTFDDARKAWRKKDDGSIDGAKGVIQMSQWLAQNTNITKANKEQAYFDTQMYGFKFLYNPTSVAMSWGINTEVNTQMESMGLDKSVPLTSGLFNSTISFELLLNRIGDMAFIDEYGLKGSSSSSFAQREGNSVYPGTSVNPWPNYVPTDDIKLIYKKGTMYDMEYLFRSVNGFNSQYKSSLNNLTADRGWLYALPVELHLGDGLRYLVRMTSISVSHNMFNERMVPILSTVSIVCTRYYDGQELVKEKT